MDKIRKIIEKCGIPYAYDHFAEGEGPAPPFICYKCPSSEPFAADGMVYLEIDTVDIELYTDRKDPVIEERIEKELKASGFVFHKNEVWIPDERLYEVVYEFETEVIGNAEK